MVKLLQRFVTTYLETEIEIRILYALVAQLYFWKMISNGVVHTQGRHFSTNIGGGKNFYKLGILETEFFNFLKVKILVVL